MKIPNHSMSMLTALVLAAGLFYGTICAADEHGMQGWGLNDPYNKHYDLTKYEKFRAWVPNMKNSEPGSSVSRPSLPCRACRRAPLWL